MDMLFSKSVLLWKVSFLALLGKLALPGRSFLGDRDFGGASASGALMLRGSRIIGSTLANFKSASTMGYERMMGAWIRLAGEIFPDWLSPRSDLRWRLV